MQHFVAAPRAEAEAATGGRRISNADVLPGARQLMALIMVAAFLLAATMFGAILYAVGKIDETAVESEMARARLALATVEAASSEQAIANAFSQTFALAGARVGGFPVGGEVALPLPAHPGRSIIWTPRRIGSELFAQLAPLRLGASAAFLIGILALMRRLYGVAREHESRRREAQALAAMDSLTGLGNRLSFDDGLARRLASEDRVALFFLDLDGFKQVNDTLGHGAGDDVLRAVGQRLSGLAPSEGLVARVGGDEFALVLPPPEDGETGLADFARRIEGAFAEPILLGTNPVQIGASVGVAVAPADGRDAAALMLAADQALYRAKRDRSGFALATAA